MSPARHGRCARRVSYLFAGPLAVSMMLAACGVEPQTRPEPIPSARLPSLTSPQPSDSSTPAARTRVWGVREQRAVPVFVTLRDAGIPARLEALLLLGEPGQQLGTAVVRGTRVESVMQRGGLLLVNLSAEFRRAPNNDIPLALAQVVLTVTEVPGVDQVEVRAGGVPVALVDPSGKTVSRPLRRTDFAGLVEGGRTD